MNLFRLATLFLVLVCTKPLPAADAPAVGRPNILWIIVDDMSPNFSSFGEKAIQTPHVDRLVREGVQFTRCFVTAPICSPCRSALITGMYQTTIGAQNHRSGRGVAKIHLPAGVEPIPALFQRAGYYTCIGSGPTKGTELGKTDYNFEWNPSIYDGSDWSGRSPGQPFFMQVQLRGGKHRHRANWKEIVKRQLGSATRPEDVRLPPYYPRDAVILEDWAEYLDCCRFTDNEVGKVIQRLTDEGLLENTVVFFMTDHGISHARGKQFLYDEGTHVPLVVRCPGISRGVVRDDLVEHIDVAGTSLALAGISLPQGMQSRNLLARNSIPRDAVFAARDRSDETVERIRSVRTGKFKYIRNFFPERPHLQPNVYKDGKPIVQRLRELHNSGNLPPLAEALLFSPTRAPEELYDLEADPHETKNVASDPAHQPKLVELRERLVLWMEETRDQGRQPESAEMYDSDMAVYLAKDPNKNTERLKNLQRNIELMKRWTREGK